MAIIDDINTIKSNVELLKKISKDNNTNVTITGRYYHDINLVLQDYITTKEQISLLLQSSGTDADKLSELTAINNKLNRELIIIKSENKEYEQILDEIVRILNI